MNVCVYHLPIPTPIADYYVQTVNSGHSTDERVFPPGVLEARDAVARQISSIFVHLNYLETNYEWGACYVMPLP